MEFLETLEIFASDLFSFVLHEHYDWNSSRNISERDDGSPFYGPLKMTVRQLLRITEEASRNVFNDLIGERGHLSSVHFKLFVAELIGEVSERRYDPYEFVLFATLLSKLAIMCYSGYHCEDCASPVTIAVVEVGQRFRRKGQFNLPALLRLNTEIRLLDILRQLKVLTV